MADKNPFTPSFGTSPPVLVGREEQLGLVVDALENGVGDPFRAVKVTGLRGSGKTVFLNHVEDAARSRGWHVLSETARPGMAHRLTTVALPRLLSLADPDDAQSTITNFGVGLGGGGLDVGREVSRRYQPGDDFRSMLTRLADLADQAGVGVLITIDELNLDAFEDLREITQDVQHCGFREGRPVAFVGAGLRSEVQELLSVRGMTFLRRAEEVQFGRVTDDEVRRGLLDPIQDWGKSITASALRTAVAGTRGYPYMIQNIGHRMWANSAPSERITDDIAHEACAHALRRVGDLVLAPELGPLSRVDRSYLAAMATDDGPSRTGEIAARLNVKPSYAGVYRDRLIKAGVIYNAGHGLVDFTLPTMRDYLRSHSAAEFLDEEPKAPERPALLPPAPGGDIGDEHSPPTAQSRLESSQREQRRQQPTDPTSGDPGRSGR